MDLVTLQEFKDYNGIKKPDDDSKNAMLIASVSALIKAYLGIRTEGGETITETVSLDYDTDTIYLDKYPVDSIVSISETSRYTYDSTVHVPLVYAGDYTLDAAEGILYRHYTMGGFANWPISPGIVKIVYTTGASFQNFSGGIPSDLKLAVLELVNYYKNEEWKTKSIQGTTTNAVSTSKDGDFPTHIQVILDRYKWVRQLSDSFLSF